jgi:glucosamine--fructose-6-phosphate aminotransferase (isomerizing)
MCGIVGYIGHGEALDVLVPALRRLEYRGYDSAGVAVANGHGLQVRRTVGKIAALEESLATGRPSGRLGIAHTRWATHGRPSTTNAHPHIDCHARLAVVHNGIIENYRELRRRLAADGHRFRSETDTEVIAHLIEHYRSGDLAGAVRRAADDLRGSYAIACISDEEPHTLVAMRRGSSPLVIGYGDGEALLASDIPALLGRAREMVALADGDMAILTGSHLSIRTADGIEAQRSAMQVPWDPAAAERNGYPHFMLKEIFEQPEAIRNTLRELVTASADDVHLPESRLSDWDLQSLNRLLFIACGTSFHAALVGKYLIEAFARLPVEVDIASEFRYRDPILDGRALTVPISQSGETADTLAALRHARAGGSRSLSICNVVGSSMARESEGVLYTRAGVEIGVASTKAFTAQLASVLLLAIKLGRVRGMLDADDARRRIQDLQAAPELMERTLELNDHIRTLAGRFAAARDFLYLGRGVHYPLALEGALKLKEISYIHAEGYAAGEMKHGPIALIDAGMPVVAIAPDGAYYEKTVANIEEVKARDGMVIAIASSRDETIQSLADASILIPAAPVWIQPLLASIPLQLLAYHIAVARGCDVDQPRNLAKSVTVE